jgi:hypothetical protein
MRIHDADSPPVLDDDLLSRGLARGKRPSDSRNAC